MEQWPTKACKECVKTLEDVRRLKVKIEVAQERLAGVAAVKKADAEDDKKEQYFFEEESDMEDNKKDLHFEELDTKLEPDVIVEEQGDDEAEELEDNADEQEQEEDYESEPEKIETPKRTRKRKCRSKAYAASDESKEKRRRVQRKPLQSAAQHVKERVVLENLMRERGLLNCQLCPEETASFLDLQHHQKREHNIKTPFIYCCKKKFGRSSAVNHMKYHQNPDAFKCQCGKVWFTQYTLDHHNLRTHVKPEQVQFTCETCGKGFALMSVLESHKLSHVPVEERKIKCPLCDYKSNFDGNMQNHLKYVHEKCQDHICDVCGRGFAVRAEMLKHYRSRHTNMKSEECDICHKFVFNLPRHKLRGHLQIDELQCEHCEYKGTKFLMRNHNRKYHSGMAISLVCPICEKLYKSKRSFKEHMDGHNGIRYVYS